VGALLISHWAAGLMRESGGVLLDRSGHQTLTRKIEASIKDVNGVRIVDFHLWRLGLGDYSAILSLESSNGLVSDFFKKRMRHIRGLSHLTIEVNASPVDLESKKPSRDTRLHA